MGLYTKNGLYNGYDKHNKEREALDYYATPTNEVENILENANIDLNNKIILEPCAGGGHMVKGIENYCQKHNYTPKNFIKTDIANRGCADCLTGKEYDFFSDNYPINQADIIIMNPPYSVLEPFLIRAIEIAQQKLIVLCRMQVLEGTGRYDNIFKENPPTEIYQYIERIQCWKNGEKPTGSGSQAYCWLIWDKTIEKQEPPKLYWLHRSEE